MLGALGPFERVEEVERHHELGVSGEGQEDGFHEVLDAQLFHEVRVVDGAFDGVDSWCRG